MKNPSCILLATAFAASLLTFVSGADIVATEPSQIMDVLDLSDPSSMKQHDASTFNTSRVDDSGLHSNFTGIRLGRIDACMLFSPPDRDLQHPNTTVYLTIKVWGGEQCSPYSSPPIETFQSVYLRDAQTGNLIGNPGSYPSTIDDVPQCQALLPNRWVYITYPIPTNLTRSSPCRSGVTAGQASHAFNLSIATTSAASSRLIYRIYTHGDAFFVPPADEEQGSETPPSTWPVRPAPSAVSSKLEFMRAQFEQAVDIATEFQFYGPEWEQAVNAGHAPAVMTGAIYRQRSIPSYGSKQEWKDSVLCGTLASNNNYLRIAEMMARAYITPGQRHYKNDTLIARVASALDFYTVAQGANGGYDDRNHGNCWLGGPQRKAGSGCLEGYGHRGLSNSFLMLSDELSSEAILNVTIDDDDNPQTPNVTRRIAWTRLFNMSRSFLTSSVGRGHAPNQDANDQFASYMANLCLRILAPHLAWTEDQMLPFVYQSMGLANMPDCSDVPLQDMCNRTYTNLTTWWISPQGLSMEPHGRLQGGYSDGYGDQNLGGMLGILVDLIEDESGQSHVADTMNKWLSTFAQFRFPCLQTLANDSEASDPTFTSDNAEAKRIRRSYPGYRTLCKPSSITWRHEHDTRQPFSYGDIATSVQCARDYNNSLAKRLLKLWDADNALYNTDLVSDEATSSVHWPDFAATALRVLEALPYVLNLSSSAPDLPLEPNHPPSAFVDAYAAAVAAKTASNGTFFASSMWRHACEGNGPGESCQCRSRNSSSCSCGGNYESTGAPHSSRSVNRTQSCGYTSTLLRPDAADAGCGTCLNNVTKIEYSTPAFGRISIAPAAASRGWASTYATSYGPFFFLSNGGDPCGCTCTCVPPNVVGRRAIELVTMKMVPAVPSCVKLCEGESAVFELLA